MSGNGTLPVLDEKRIAEDEARGIGFSADKRTLLHYDGELPAGPYVIPAGVTSVGRNAFLCCHNLTGIELSDSLTALENCAFFYCSGLRQVVVPPGVTTIGGCAFAGCRNLRRVVIPPGVTDIGAGAFAGCEKLNGVTIPETWEF